MKISDWPTSGYVALDWEVRDPNLKKLGPGNHRRDGYICGAAIAFEGHAEYYPIAHDTGDNWAGEEFIPQFVEWLSRFNGTLIAANAPFEMAWLQSWGTSYDRWEDPLLAAKVLDNRHLTYGLDAVAQREGIEGKDESGLLKAAEQMGIKPKDIKANLWKLNSADVSAYAVQDAVLCLELMDRFRPRLWSEGLDDVFRMECDLMPVLHRLRTKGVNLDFSRLSSMEEWAVSYRGEWIDKLEEITGHRVEKLLAPSQVIPALEAAGVTIPTVEKDGVTKKTTAKDKLERINHPAIDALFEARSADKILTTYLPAMRGCSVDGVLHGSFNGFGATKTSRLSSSKPNLQNQPARNELIGERWRGIFVAPKGKRWAKLDFASQEPRIVSHFAEQYLGECFMADKFRDDPLTDPHQISADLLSMDRTLVKKISNGKAYGMGSGKMALDMGMEAEEYLSWTGDWRLKAGPEAQAMIDLYDREFPFLKELIDYMRKEVERDEYVTTIGGHKLRFARIHGKLMAPYKAVNYMVQGSASYQMKRGLLALDEAGFDTRLTVHDEADLLVDSLDEAIEAAYIMANVVKFRVPSVVEVLIGDDWGNATKEYTAIGGHSLEHN